MTISYNWLCDYLPLHIEPERLSRILTSIGLEVESLEPYEEVKGGLAGLLVGEVLTCEKHPNADKLSLTTVSIGTDTPLQIVCGAPNVAAGQKVVVAPVGATIYPVKGEPITMKKAKIRGVESQGMICAEDEIGLGEDHAGILVLPADTRIGMAVADYFKPHQDWIYEIGLTPNRMDAMSHLGVARDVCAYITHHDKKDARVKSPFHNGFRADSNSRPFKVSIENKEACQRYAGLTISNVEVRESPEWLQRRLKSIGQRPVNNIVDITNFILHETGQPLHAFDADRISGDQIIVKNLPEGTLFKSLDDKERKLSAADLMICDGEGRGLCIAGVFGGANSGVQADTRHIFLESAWFNPIDIRKTSFRHGLRTEAALRFEKNIDISNTVQVLKRAALLIKELAGGEISSELIDVYPLPPMQKQVTLKFHYLKKLSGKNYHSDTVKKILSSLGFEIMREGLDDLLLAVPTSKPDISLPADVVEEIMRIDGLDNIEIPSSISISPSVEINAARHDWKEKIAGFLTGNGFNEILTNSITNAAYFEEKELQSAVRLLNNLSADHNIMRPSMLETGLEAVAHNLNRKNNNLLFFEFGKTYHQKAAGEYEEKEELCLYVTGKLLEAGWKNKASDTDLYFLKGILNGILQLASAERADWTAGDHPRLNPAFQVEVARNMLAQLGIVKTAVLKRFDIKQPVFFARIDWEYLLQLVAKQSIQTRALPRQLPVERDLAILVAKSLPFGEVEKAVKKLRIEKLKHIRLFDVFESEKLGKDKKSLALNFSFLDAEKTMTDKEIDQMMGKIMQGLEKDLAAEIRK